MTKRNAKRRKFILLQPADTFRFVECRREGKPKSFVVNVLLSLKRTDNANLSVNFKSDVKMINTNLIALPLLDASK